MEIFLQDAGTLIKGNIKSKVTTFTLLIHCKYISVDVNKLSCLLNYSPVQQERSDSPEPSCVSMKSDWSIDPPPEIKGGDRQSVRYTASYDIVSWPYVRILSPLSGVWRSLKPDTPLSSFLELS